MHHCWLGIGNSRSFFNYVQNFQIARIFGERTGGAALYSYFECPLGQPTDLRSPTARAVGSRIYEGGQVFVAPAQGELQQLQVGFDSWTTTGTPHS